MTLEMVATSRREILTARMGGLWDGPVPGALIATLLTLCVLALLGAPLLLPALAGLAVAAVGTFLRPRDTHRIAAEMAQSQEAMRTGIQAMLSGIADPVIVLDRQGNVSIFNAQAKTAP